MFQRYAVYYTPEGDLATLGASWLGWDMARGARTEQPRINGLKMEDLTSAPRRYGLHGTIKAPFALATGMSADDLALELEALCSGHHVVSLERLEVGKLGRFIALVPSGDPKGLATVAADVVMSLDHFRAPPSKQELERRRKARLTAEQEKNLITWGYPHVMDAFKFHITLTGRVVGDAGPVEDAARAFFDPLLPSPFFLSSLTLAGEDRHGFFHQIHRFALVG